MTDDSRTTQITCIYWANVGIGMAKLALASRHLPNDVGPMLGRTSHAYVGPMLAWIGKAGFGKQAFGPTI